MAVDVLDHHDGVVGDEPQRRRDPGESHEVDGLAEDAEPERDDAHARRDRDDRDQREPEAAQEDEQHERGESDADQDCVAHAADRVGYVSCLVIERGPPHAFGQQIRLGLEQLVDCACDLDGVRGGLTDDVHQDGWMRVGGGADVGDLVRDLHLAQLAQGRRDSPRHRHRDALEGVQAIDPTVHQGEVQLVVALGEAGGEHLVVLLQGRDDISRSEMSCVQRGPVELHFELAVAASDHEDLRDSWNAEQGGLEFEVRQLAQLGLRSRVRGQRVALDGEHRRVHPLDVDLRLGRQIRTHSLRLRFDPLERRLHVRAPAELRSQLRRAARGDRAHQLDARHPQDGFLQRTRHRRHHVSRRLLPHVGNHLDEREGDRWKDRRGHAEAASKARSR